MNEELLGVGRTFIFSVLSLIATVLLIMVDKLTVTTEQWIMLIGTLSALWVGKKFAERGKTATTGGTGDSQG